MSKEPIEYVKHIADECSFIITVTANVSRDTFMADETLKRAIVRSLEIIGEATKKIPATFREEWISIEWRSMAAMRDRLIHDYIGINYLIVWDVVENKIPALSVQIEKVLNNEH